MGLFDWWKRKDTPPTPASTPTARANERAEVEDLPAELQHLPRRPAWLPETIDRAGEPRGSRIGGHAFIPAGEDHPACGVCGKPLHLVVQLNSAELPTAVSAWTGPGIFQMFYCLSECELEADGWAPYSRVHCARRVDLDAPGQLTTTGPSVPAKAIVAWRELDDLPHQEEWPTAMVDELETACELAERPLAGDKLAGWPYWVQGPEYPQCKLCGAAMRVLFQVDSEHNLAWMWGDAGCAQLSVCEEHRDQLAFGWACC